MGGPLYGVTVVALEQLVSAPFALRHLADLGRVEDGFDGARPARQAGDSDRRPHRQSWNRRRAQPGRPESYRRDRLNDNENDELWCR
ncbi:hypothetical protein EAH80_01075 [Mycobacterium hodleri]|uniref:Uncharacterized protein n=1 Tax=Mycolicibacterium hodleri TaxID=49897 RepID=A0A502EFX8_9MYCO|nr:hypothetical protein EAH80_01075 [Mycolicibacterium hodleri]